jgi:rhodanese-related sulfurtransferase
MAVIDEYLEKVRSELDRVRVEELDAELAAGAVLVDIRPVEVRSRDGEMPGALIIDRNVLEWRLDPTCDWRSVDLQDGQRVILFCSEDYASSLAAGTLQELGITGATDLVGGYKAWLAFQEDRA